MDIQGSRLKLLQSVEEILKKPMFTSKSVKDNQAVIFSGEMLYHATTPEVKDEPERVSFDTRVMVNRKFLREIIASHKDDAQLADFDRFTSPPLWAVTALSSKTDERKQKEPSSPEE